MEIVGKIHQLGENIAGTTERGVWVRKTVVVETMDSRPKKIAFGVHGEEKARLFDDVKTGDLIRIKFYPVSREFDGRWYSELICYDIETLGS